MQHRKRSCGSHLVVRRGGHDRPFF